MARRRAILGAALLFLLALAPPAQAASSRFSAILHEADREVMVGRVQLDAKARITVITASSDRRAWLRRIARRMNEKATMHVDAPPPANSPRASASRIVKRGEPDFLPALQDYLRTYYKLELRPL